MKSTAAAVPDGPTCRDDDEYMARARLHQSRFRAAELGLSSYRAWGNRLTSDAALAGRNFYAWPGMLDAVDARFGRGDKKLFWDMLASDHVPFNFFIPLRTLPHVSRALVAGWVGDVLSVDDIRMEWAPAPRRAFLDDRTSFDVYVAYTSKDGGKGGIGIEVKFTEGAYAWAKTERARMFDDGSLYNQTSRGSDLYVDGATSALRTPRFKQFWRNQLLGEAMRQRGDLRHFTSLLLHPSGNTHFGEAAHDYTALLRPGARSSFVAMTFETFIQQCGCLDASPAVTSWLRYLERRYIVA
ncbi:MAG: hypothetical protein Q8O67_20890 [Deltaproteobacteria bacterium]|nr:hypothetical protein [Deltaproteobacteria bacterium]